MKELIHQQAADFVFFKDGENYSILLLAGLKRKNDKEYKLNETEKKKYFDRGLVFIRELVEKKSKK